MFKKWLFGALVVVLALFGISSGQVAAPNQEIVVQFNGDQVTVDEAQHAIAIVKRQLQIIGVESIQVVAGEQGAFKITYYSDVDVAVIKGVFSEGEKLELGSISYSEEKEPLDNPVENNETSYQLNVCEIQLATDFGLDLDGYLLEFTSGNDNYLNPNVNFHLNEIDVRNSNNIEKVAYSVQRNVALRFDGASYKIPEVRAGPVS